MIKWLKILRQKFLDVQFNVSNEIETRIIECPGLWMSNVQLDELSEKLRKIGARTIPDGELTYGVFAGDRKAFKSSVITLVTRKSNGQPIAFNALVKMDLELAEKPIEVLHMGLVMVDPDERSRGLSWVLYGLTCFLLFLRNQFRPIWISNVTQVPAVVGMVSETFSQVYPDAISEDNRSLLHLLIARQILNEKKYVFGVGKEAPFDENRFIITNAYTGGSDNLKKSYEQSAKHRDEQYNDFCKTELDYQRGDDVLQLGQIDIQAARKYLFNSVPGSSVASLLLLGSITFLQRLVLPLWYWFDTTRHWNSLRPYK